MSQTRAVDVVNGSHPLRPELYEAAFRFLSIAHEETECGDRGTDHWQECSSLCEALGFESWDDWRRQLATAVGQPANRDSRPDVFESAPAVHG